MEGGMNASYTRDGAPPCAPAAGKALDAGAAAELRTSQARLARVLEASCLGLWEYDCQSHDTYLSQGWSELLGLPGRASRLGAEQFSALIPPHERGSVDAARRQLLKGEIERVSMEHEVTTADGGAAWLLTEAQVSERGADGRALKILGTCKNITERKTADAALRAALQAAEQANRAKSEFLATMSHEIRTPLNGVIGLTEVLSGAQLPAMEADAVAMIDSCAKALLSVVDNILDFSKIEAGRLTLEDVHIDVHRLVREVGDVFGVRGAEKGVRFELSVDDDVPQWVLADPMRLRQILLNLLGNALKFTPGGSFSLALRLLEDGPAPQLAFTVADTGIGISEADQAHLFTRFAQVDASNTRKYGGTGLGLAISRQLAQLMGGDVDLASRPGEGSTFTLRIPLREAQAPASAAPATPRGQVRADAAILLAEDNAVNQLVAQRLLGMMGYRNITPVYNGREAVEACGRRPFDLVLMDCQMPELDGWQATRSLRALGHEMPIVALTASAIAGDRERCLMAGMNDYLTKPIESALLAQKVDRWLNEPRAQAKHPPAADPPPPPAEPEPAVFERGAIAERFMGDVALFHECRGLFLCNTQVSLDAMGNCLREGDDQQVRRLAHTVKGSAAQLGAARLADCCSRIELASAAGAMVPAASAWLAQASVALQWFTLESEHAV
jgi:PAS domain S-box-containing protein